MFNGEDDLVEDLKLVRKTYADSLIHLNILSSEEEQLVFGHMSALTPVHQLFHSALKRAQCKDGFWFSIGPAVEKWIRIVEAPYVDYCSNLLAAKVTRWSLLIDIAPNPGSEEYGNILTKNMLSLHCRPKLVRKRKVIRASVIPRAIPPLNICPQAFLDKKQAEDKAFSDFLQRCIESPFSRKLDLWTFLDVPRSRLVKYPLLLKQVLKYSEDTDDIATINNSIAELERIIGLVDTGMAQAR